MNEELLRALLANVQQRETEAPKKRKRGGLAGIWDRNKKIIKPIVGAGLGALTGGLAAPAIAGGLMGGLDREGKRGIGFDVGKGIGGAASGAAAGAIGRFGAGKVRGMLGSQGASQQAAGMTGADMTPAALPGQTVATPAAGATPPAPPDGGQSAGGLMGALRGAGSFVQKNPNAAGMMFQGAAGVLGSQSDRRMREQEMALMREREDEDRRRRAMTAGLLLPLYQQERGRMGL